MPGFGSIKALVDREETAGASLLTTWRKTPSVTTSAGFWQDLSMSPGNPKPNYYASAPLIGARMAYSTDGGIYHGVGVSPASMRLRRLMALTVTAGAVPLPMMLCDYLLYYPFIDESILDDEQLMDDRVTPATLPRYTTGVGVQMMAVVVAGHSIGTGTKFSVRYVNDRGTQSTSQTVQLGTQFVNGTIATTALATAQCLGPFIPLAKGDYGVRSILGVTFTNIADVGLLTIALVKPLADIALRGIDAPSEVDYLLEQPTMPEIVDDAYLNFIVCPSGSLAAAPIHGIAMYTWT